MMRINPGLLVFFFASLIVSLTARGAGAQTATVGTEIPLQRCDRLPVAILQVDKADNRFLIDKAATSLLNEKSFPRGRTKEVHVQSCNQTTGLNDRRPRVGQPQPARRQAAGDCLDRNRQSVRRTAR